MPVPRVRVASPLRQTGNTESPRKARLAMAETVESVDVRGGGSEANRVWKFKWTQRRETWDFVRMLFGTCGSRTRRKAFRTSRSSL